MNSFKDQSPCKAESRATLEAARLTAVQASRHRLRPEELLLLVCACAPFPGATPRERLEAALAVYREALDDDLHGGRAEVAAFDEVVRRGGSSPSDLRRIRGEV